ncbi:hypothetical protein Tco_1355043 [Tanacetum coccineum]
MYDKYPYKTNYPTPVPIDEWDTRCHITHTWNTSNQNIPNNDPTPLGHSESRDKANISESLKIQPFRPRPCDYAFDEWLKVKIGHTNIYDSDREIGFNEWILDSFDFEEEYAKEIENPYSRRFDEYKRVFYNEIEIFSNEYTLRVEKRGFEEEELWGQNFICITKQDDDALPIGRVNGARFKAMIRKELKDKDDIELDEEARYTFDEGSVTSKHEALDPAHVNNARSLDEELSSEEDLDEWLKGEMEKHMIVRENLDSKIEKLRKETVFSRLSRMSNTSDKGTTFGDGAARVGMQLRSSPKVSPSSPLLSPSTIINVPRELYSIDVAATFGVPLTTVGDLQKLINDIDAGKHDELLSELTNKDRMETLKH